MSFRVEISLTTSKLAGIYLIVAGSTWMGEYAVWMIPLGATLLGVKTGAEAYVKRQGGHIEK